MFASTENIGVDKMLSWTKYSHQQNVGIDKIFASTKYWRQQNTHVNKILVSTKYSCRQNSHIEKMSAQARKYLLTVWLSRVHSCWLLPDLADDLLRLLEGVDPSTCSRQVCRCHCPPCFYGRTLSHTVPAYCTGPPCRKRHKYWHQQNIGARQDCTDFHQTIAVNSSAHRRPTKNWWKQKVITITVQYQFIYSLSPK